MSLRQWQLHLPDKRLDTRLTRWMHSSFRHMLSLLPLYFDRVRTFAKSLYGFDTTRLWKDNKKSMLRPEPNHNEAIGAFLRKQAKLGGPPTAVVLVLDGVGTNNCRVELGCHFSNDKNPERLEKMNIQSLWPAMYVRSTLHLSASSASSSVLSPQSNLLHNWSSSSLISSSPVSARKSLERVSQASPLGSRAKTTANDPQSLFEYAPDTGPVNSWPHSDWEALVDILKHTPEPVNGKPLTTRTVRYDEDNDVLSPDELTSVKDVTLLFKWKAEVASKGRLDAGTSKRQSTFHAVKLGKWVSFVVIVKEGEEGGRWLSKKKHLDDDEIRSFIGDLSKTVSVGSVFDSSTVLALKKPEDFVLDLTQEDDLTLDNEEKIQDFLLDLKEVFGLRSSSPFVPEASRDLHLGGFGSRSPKTPRARRFRGRRPATSDTESAAIFFLGADLASLMTS